MRCLPLDVLQRRHINALQRQRYALVQAGIRQDLLCQISRSVAFLVFWTENALGYPSSLFLVAMVRAMSTSRGKMPKFASQQNTNSIFFDWTTQVDLIA